MILPTNYNGLNAAQRKAVRLQYQALQDNKCCHCGEPLDKPAAPHIKKLPLLMRLFPPGFLKNPVHLHHDHDTGLTIGAVHAYCNGVLWQYHGK